MRPQSKSDLFWSFTWLALQGFGGVMAVVQKELVERKKWLTPAEFAEEWAVAQLLPGPNVINLSIMLGDRHFGWAGALAAMAGLLCVPTALALLIVALFANAIDSPMMHAALRGMGSVVAGLIAANAWKLARALKGNPLGIGLCLALAAASFYAIVHLHLALVLTLLVLGMPAGWLAAARLRKDGLDKTQTKR